MTSFGTLDTKLDGLISTGWLPTSLPLTSWLPTRFLQCVWGLDIGGANLKVAVLSGTDPPIVTRHRPFALWQNPLGLSAALGELTRDMPRPDSIAVTMTGEIADCYEHKSQGVAEIIHHCQAAFATTTADLVYYCPGFDQSSAFQSADVARLRWPQVAASNWHAVATLCRDTLADHLPGPGMVVDLGSTTLDLTWVSAGQPVLAQSDYQRLRAGNLVYTGCRRSPLAMILPRMDFDGQPLPLAQELFATIGDVYLVTGDLTADPESRATADGRAATIRQAQQRLARMLCSDADELPANLIDQMADQAKTTHLKCLAAAIARQLQSREDGTTPPPWLLLMGEGESILQQALALPIFEGASASRLLSAGEMLGETASAALPALAVAVLRIGERFRKRETRHV